MTRTPIAAPMPIPALVPVVKAEVEGCVEGDDGEGVLVSVLVGVVADPDDAVGRVREEGVGVLREVEEREEVFEDEDSVEAVEVMRTVLASAVGGLPSIAI